VLILYEGAAPTVRESAELVRVVERETGVDLLGVPVTTLRTDEAIESRAQSAVTRLERESRLGQDATHRTTVYTAEAASGRRVVAVVWAVERNPWVRTAIPSRLATGDPHLTSRPGWARLAREPVLAFVAAATDGATRRFPDVHVVVSLLPEVAPRRIRGLLPGGYPRWVDDVIRGTGASVDGTDVAHWLVCAAGRRRRVRLAYLAGESAVWPGELLTRVEKRGRAKLA
jgi:hypothetical protein